MKPLPLRKKLVLSLQEMREVMAALRVPEGQAGRMEKWRDGAPFPALWNLSLSCRLRGNQIQWERDDATRFLRNSWRCSTECNSFMMWTSLQDKGWQSKNANIRVEVKVRASLNITKYDGSHVDMKAEGLSCQRAWEMAFCTEGRWKKQCIPCHGFCTMWHCWTSNMHWKTTTYKMLPPAFSVTTGNYFF